MNDPTRTTTDGQAPDGVTVGAPKPINPATGQHGAYYVLSEAERAKGFRRPVRRSYVHDKCGFTTTMAPAIAETYARDPFYYGRTFCVGCGEHLPVAEFRWAGTTDEYLGESDEHYTRRAVLAGMQEKIRAADAAPVCDLSSQAAMLQSMGADPAKPFADPQARRWSDLTSASANLENALGLLRSAGVIAARKGAETNWDAFHKRVTEALAAFGLRPVSPCTFRDTEA